MKWRRWLAAISMPRSKLSEEVAKILRYFTRCQVYNMNWYLKRKYSADYLLGRRRNIPLTTTYRRSHETSHWHRRHLLQG
jgi:hypothetical protein